MTDWFYDKLADWFLEGCDPPHWRITGMAVSEDDPPEPPPAAPAADREERPNAAQPLDLLSCSDLSSNGLSAEVGTGTRGMRWWSHFCGVFNGVHESRDRLDVP